VTTRQSNHYWIIPDGERADFRQPYQLYVQQNIIRTVYLLLFSGFPMNSIAKLKTIYGERTNGK
jgi:hypothetical protein